MNINLPVRHIRVFGWRIYFSRYPMKRRTTSTIRSAKQRQKKGRHICKKKAQRYRQLGGRCQICGQHCESGQMEMHHILPVAGFPGLAKDTTNMMLLCRRCHFLVHHDPTLNMMLMSRFAVQKGINLSKRYHCIAAKLWIAMQAAQQKKLEIEKVVVS